MSPKRSPVITLQNVTKHYEVRHQRPTLIENVLARKKRTSFTSIDHLNLNLYKGERVGVIGTNGSGKTTLLKLISGITSPTEGTIGVRGKVVSLIDLEAGFHPDLTGRENILLNGLTIGMSKKEIEQKSKKIIRFTDIGEFIDAPLYTYSAGMTLRLGFSVAVHAEPDILLLDESILAGDKFFQAKITEKIQSFFAKRKTVVIVSHWLEYLEASTTRIIWLQDGKIVQDGGLEVIHQYRRSHEH
jgi:ABC-2 type transport system ATP-binding protein